MKKIKDLKLATFLLIFTLTNQACDNFQPTKKQNPSHSDLIESIQQKDFSTFKIEFEKITKNFSEKELYDFMESNNYGLILDALFEKNKTVLVYLLKQIKRFNTSSHTLFFENFVISFVGGDTYSIEKKIKNKSSSLQPVEFDLKNMQFTLECAYNALGKHCAPLLAQGGTRLELMFRRAGSTGNTGCTEIAIILLKYLDKLEKTNKQKFILDETFYSIFHYALLNGHHEVVKLLVKFVSGAKLSNKQMRQFVLNKKIKLALKVVASEAENSEQASNYKKTISIILELIRENILDTEEKNQIIEHKNFLPFLYFAVKNKKTEISKFCLKLVKETKLNDSILYKFTRSSAFSDILSEAAENGLTSIVKLLIGFVKNYSQNHQFYNPYNIAHSSALVLFENDDQHFAQRPNFINLLKKISDKKYFEITSLLVEETTNQTLYYIELKHLFKNPEFKKIFAKSFFNTKKSLLFNKNFMTIMKEEAQEFDWFTNPIEKIFIKIFLTNNFSTNEVEDLLEQDNFKEIFIAFKLETQLKIIKILSGCVQPERIIFWLMSLDKKETKNLCTKEIYEIQIPQKFNYSLPNIAPHTNFAANPTISEKPNQEPHQEVFVKPIEPNTFYSKIKTCKLENYFSSLQQRMAEDVCFEV